VPATGTRWRCGAHWGADYIQLYNDAVAPIFADKPSAGLPACVTWAEMWDFVSGLFDTVVRTGKAWAVGTDTSNSSTSWTLVERYWVTHPARKLYLPLTRR
jgi:hypothetical protein